MPGLYISDGGATSSALGNALGGLAAAVGPKAQAEALLTRQQTEAADYQNKLLNARLQGVLGIPGTTAAMSADPTAGAAGGSVAGTLAGVAVPPDPATPFARNYTAGFSPFNQVLAGSYAADPSMANFSTGVNLGRTATLGPGSDYATQTEVAKAKALPYDLTAGVTRHIPGGAPAGGAETVVEGPSQADIAAQTKSLEETTAEAHQALARGKQAISDDAELADIIKGYDALVNIPDGDISNPAVLEGLKAATAMTGGAFDFTRLNSKQEAIDDLTKRMQLMWGSTRALGGDPGLRGYGDVMSRALDVAKNSSPSFHRMADVFHRELVNLKDEMAAAQPFVDAPSAAAAPAFHNTLITNRQRRADELRKQGFSAADSTGGDNAGAGGGAGGPSSAPTAPAAPAPSKPTNVRLVPDIATGEKGSRGSFFRTPDGKLYKVQ